MKQQKEEKAIAHITGESLVHSQVQGFYLVLNCNEDVNSSGLGKHRVQVKKWWFQVLEAGKKGGVAFRVRNTEYTN